MVNFEDEKVVLYRTHQAEATALIDNVFVTEGQGGDINVRTELMNNDGEILESNVECFFYPDQSARAYEEACGISGFPPVEPTLFKSPEAESLGQIVLSEK